MMIKMNDPKVPCITNDWQTMDIFVFSNGQQNSPPRKYHLQAEELNWWDATLNHLARSQYGSIHSTIDLYTTDGHKLEGPLQIQNGTAYVAVLPPNPFIDTGYDKYLVKATRSLEKRQAKKPNSNEKLLQDENTKKSEQMTEDVIIATTNILKDNAGVELTAVNSSEHLNKTLKPTAPDTQRSSQKSNLISTKQTDKKRSLGSRPPLIRRISTLNPIEAPPDSRKVVLKKKNGSPKKNFKAPGKTNELPAVVNLDVPNSVSKTIYNQVKEAIPQPIVDSLKAKNVPTETTDLSLATTNTAITSNNQANNLMNDKDIGVSNLYKNSVSDMISIVVDADGNTAETECITHNLIKINEESATSQNYKHFDNQTVDNASQKNKTEPKISSKIKFTNAPSIQGCSADKPDDNYLAVINRGDIINFQLKIEVRNAEGTVTTSKPSKPTSKASFKPNKSSQVRIDSDIFLQSKSVHSTFGSDYAHLINGDGNSKVIVMQCECCDLYRDNINRQGQTELKDNRRYVMVLPPQKCRGYHERCECDVELPNEKELKKTYYRERSSIIHSIKKTYSDMSLERLHNDIIPTIDPEHILTQDMNVTATDSTNLTTNEDVYSRSECISTSRHVAVDEQQAKSEFKVVDLIVPNPTEIVVETKNTDNAVIKKTVPSKFVDKSTQTEWCNLLLEARCDDDGRYTFHLPPLQVLKYYTI